MCPDCLVENVAKDDDLYFHPNALGYQRSVSGDSHADMMFDMEMEDDLQERERNEEHCRIVSDKTKLPWWISDPVWDTDNYGCSGWRYWCMSE